MEISATFNDHGALKHFQATPQMIDRAVKDAISAVANEMLREVRGKDGLSMFGRHKAGTPTPSAPGQPPAQISGDLRKSVKKFPVHRHGHGDYSVSVMPTAPYAKIQEKGGTITPKTKPYLAFQINGQWVFARSVTIPARPFIEPARKRLRKNDRIQRMFRHKMYESLKRHHA